MAGTRIHRSFLASLLVAAATAAWGASIPSSEVDPRDAAADSFRRGVRYREEAVRFEQQAETLAGEERERALGKARKEFERASRAFRSALEADASMHEAATELGFALRKLGDYEESLAAYERALELQPGYSPAIEYRAEAYLGLGRLEEAKAAYLELFRSAREHADQLLAAMKRWVEQRQAAPGDLAPAAIEEFAGWVAEREALAQQSADLAAGGSDSGW